MSAGASRPAYIYAFRGSPFFIQLFLVYTLMLSLNLSVWQPLGIAGFVLHPLFLAPVVLIINTSAYTAEILAGALRTVPKGELDAAAAFGMTRAQTFRSVIWPNAIRIAWPAYTNELVFLFQVTALIYFTLPVIAGQQELMSRATTMVQRDYNVFLHFGVAAGYFLAIALVIFFFANWFYRYLMRHTATPVPARVRFNPRYLR